MYFVADKMGTFELRGYYPVKKKLLFLFFSIFVFFVANCAKIGPPVPLRKDYTGAEEKVIPPVLVYGTVVENRDSVGVQKYDEASWINLQFKDEIDTTSLGIKVIDVTGNEIQFVREWDVYEDRTFLVLKPKERLNYNTVCVLNISGAEVYKLKGKYVDFDGDGVGGEAIDDDLIFPFVTFKTDNSKGDWSSVTEDKFPPFVVSSLEFLINEKPTDYLWTDVNIALSIYDYAWELADTSVIVGAVDTATISKDDFKIIEENSGEKVTLKSVSYIADPNNADFGKVIIDPGDNLKPQSWYVLRVFGGISDMSGNKLGEEDSVVFQQDFRTFTCNHDSTECVRDTISPVVLDWKDLGPSFEVAFSEIINAESISDSSVYIPDVKGEISLRNELGQTFVRFTTLKRVSVSGYTAFVTDEIRDLSGNKIKEVSHYFGKEVD